MSVAEDRPTILVVEDDQTIRTLMNFGLKNAGFHVIAANNGEEAMPLLETHTPSLVLLDLYMPKMDGLELLHWIRETKGLKVPTVVISGVEEAREQAYQSGANAFLSKPVDLVTLLETVHGYLD